MKNSKKILTLLAFTPLLVGCGNNVKSPKFLKKGDEVSATKFVEAFQKKVNALSISKDKKLGQAVLTSKVAYQDITEKIRDKKTITKRDEISTQEGINKFDPSQLLVSQVIKGETIMVGKEGGSTGSSTLTVGQKTEIQFKKVGKKDYLVMANHDTKQYVPLMDCNKKEAAESLDYQAKNMSFDMFSDVEQMYDNYTDADEKGKKNYKFYQNENIFTIELVEKEESKLENYKTVKTVETTAQVDLTEGKMKAMYFSKEVEERTYTSNYYSYAKDDIQRDTSINAIETKFEAKNPKISPTDLSGYKAVDFAI